RVHMAWLNSALWNPLTIGLGRVDTVFSYSYWRLSMDIPPPLPGAESALDDPVSNGEFIRLATRRDARCDWTRRLSDEYQRLHQGRFDIEYLTFEAYAVYPFLSHRPPEECARQRFGFDTGADRFEVQAEQKFRTLAGNIGLIAHGQP